VEKQEITLEQLKLDEFIEEKVIEIKSIVGKGTAINALSGGVDSSVVTMLGHRTLGDQFRTVIIENGIMRQGEVERVAAMFRERGIPVRVYDAVEDFFNALRGLTDPEEKRQAITDTFYKVVLKHLIEEEKAKYLLQGTNFTDIEETIAGIKRQHNILEQLGIDTEKEYGYRVIEPLKQIRKPAIRIIAKALGLPDEIVNRPPFPGPALATRVIGEVTPERVEVVRQATSIVEEELAQTDAFQYLAILHKDLVTGIRNGKRKFGQQIEIRCWDSEDATIGTPTNLPFKVLTRIANRITTEILSVVSVTYNIAEKPPSTIEAI